MKSKVMIIAAILAIGLMSAPAFATLSQTVDFSVSGTTLTVTLTNTSTDDVLVPTDVLTGVFWTSASHTILTPQTALVYSPNVFEYASTSNPIVPTNPTVGNPYNVGGEWAYRGDIDSISGLPSVLSGITAGISSFGGTPTLSIFGNGNFNGSNLDNPNAVDGGNYGIASAGDDVSTGNADIKGNPLIKNSVVFTLTCPEGYNPSTDISHILFNYGTSVNVIPIPPSALLVGTGVLGLVILRKRLK
jgi:hypothetical protein